MPFYQGKKTEKKELKKQKASKGEGPCKNLGESWGECPQDRKPPSQRSRRFTNPPGWKGTPKEVEQDARKGRDALRLPGTLTDQLLMGKSALSSIKYCSTCSAGSRSSSEGLGLQIRGDGAAWLGAQIQQHRPGSTGRPRHSSGSSLQLGQAKARKAQDSKDAPAPSLADQRQGSQTIQALETESSIVTVRAESRAPELVTANVVIPPGASQGKQPQLSPEPDRGRSSYTKC